METTAGPTTPSDHVNPVLFRDELTKIYNRRFWTQQFPIYCQWARESNSPLSAAILDVTGLQQVNESQGYAEGNAALVRIARVLRNYTGEGSVPREYCLPVRYAGGRFCLLLPGVGARRAAMLVSGIAAQIRRIEEELEISVGLATYPDDTHDPRTLLELAERAAGAARQSGALATPLDIVRQALDKENLHLLFPTESLVGRDTVVERLKGLVSRPLVRKPVIVVHGGPGSGKSRILDEVRNWAHPRLSQSLLLRCLPFLQPHPFGVLLEALQNLTVREPRLREQMLRPLDAADRALLRAFIPQWSRSTLLDVPPAELESNPLERLESAFVRMLQAISEKPLNRSLVLLVDDAQWLDPHTLNVLSRLKDAKDASTLIVLAFRSGPDGLEAGPEQEQALSRLDDDGLVETHELTPLTESDVAELLGSVIPGLVVSPEALKTIHRQSGGVPTLVEEIVKYLVYTERIHATEDGLRLSALTEAEIPGNVPDLLSVRTQHMDVELLSLVSDASVLGSTFDLEMLLAIEPDKSESHVTGLLDVARRVGMLREDTPGRFEFTSRTAYESFYVSLGAAERKRLHGLVAEAEEARVRRGGRLDPVTAARLAFHWEAAGQPERARDTLQGAAWGQSRRPTRKSRAPSEALPLAAHVLRTLKTALQNRRTFPIHSEVVQASCTQLQQELSGLLEAVPKASLVYTAVGWLLNETPLTDLQHAARVLKDLGASLSSESLHGVWFARGLGSAELEAFIDLLARSRDTIAAEGGWATVLTVHGITHAGVEEKPYRKLARDTLRRRTSKPNSAQTPDVREYVKNQLSALLQAVEGAQITERTLTAAESRRVLSLQTEILDAFEEVMGLLTSPRRGAPPVM